MIQRDKAAKAAERALAAEYAREIGKNIAELRDAANETQAEAAYACGTDPGTWSRWELGKTAPSALSIRNIALHFSVTPDRILVGKAYEPFVETPEWREFLSSPYGKLAAERGWIDALKIARLPTKKTPQAYEFLVHLLMSDSATRQK